MFDWVLAAWLIWFFAFFQMEVDDTEYDPFQLELELRNARTQVVIQTAGLALIHTQDVAPLMRLFQRSSYRPGIAGPSTCAASGRKSVYRELRNDDLVDHAFWMARRFFPNNLEAVRLYVMLSVNIYFRRVDADVQPKALEHLEVDDHEEEEEEEEVKDSTVAAAAAAAAAEFSDDDDAPSQPKTADAAAKKFSVPVSGAWVHIKRPPGGRDHKKERGEPSLTMRHPGFYDLDTLPLQWPAEVDPAYIYDNDAMALLVLSPSAHGALRFRPNQPITVPRGCSPDATRFVLEQAAWPVFVGSVGSRVRRIYMPTDAVVVAAEKMRLMRFTAQGLNTKEVAAYWPTDARTLHDFNRAERPDGSRLWLVTGPTLCHNTLLSKRLPTLPKGVSGAAKLASDGREALYRRFPSWYMPTVDRIEVFVAYILTSSPNLLRSLARDRAQANSAEINRKYKCTCIQKSISQSRLAGLAMRFAAQMWWSVQLLQVLPLAPCRRRCPSRHRRQRRRRRREADGVWWCTEDRAARPSARQLQLEVGLRVLEVGRTACGTMQRQCSYA